jgi:AraC-like DNA-binding protein
MVMELSYSIAYRFMRLVTSEDGSRWQINFRHRNGLSATRYKRYFKCPVRLDQPRYSLTFPSELLGVPIDPANGDLRLNAERMLSNLMRRFPLDVGRQAESLVDRQLAHGGGSIQRIAKQLGLHTRTLQRRLAEQGLIFEDIVDDVRRARAEEYLPYGAIPLVQVAAMLGYSEQSSLNRSCLRWFGKTPALLRAEGFRRRPGSRKAERHQT